MQIFRYCLAANPMNIYSEVSPTDGTYSPLSVCGATLRCSESNPMVGYVRGKQKSSTEALLSSYGQGR